MVVSCCVAKATGANFATVLTKIKNNGNECTVDWKCGVHIMQATSIQLKEVALVLGPVNIEQSWLVVWSSCQIFILVFATRI